MNYVFAKIALTWGDALYASRFGDGDQLRVVKRDWAKDILTAIRCGQRQGESDAEFAARAKASIDDAFSEIRTMVGDRREWDFPDLRKVCAYMAKRPSTQAHKPFRPDRALPDHRTAEAAKAEGEKTLSSLKNLFGNQRN